MEAKRRTGRVRGLPRRATILGAGLLAAGLLGSGAPHLRAQGAPSHPAALSEISTEEYNRRLNNLRKDLSSDSGVLSAEEYRIGANDILDITVFDAPELNRSVRVTSGGEISLPLLGPLRAAGLTARELELSLEVRLRREFMKDPHVGVFVSTVESHPISVVGAVRKPGVFQVRGPRSLLEMISMADGVTDDAGDKVLIERGAGLHPEVLAAQAAAGSASAPASSSSPLPAEERSAADANSGDATPSGAPETSAPSSSAMASAADPSAAPAPAEADADADVVEVHLDGLVQSGQRKYNVTVFPGDIVKVTRAGIVYAVGEVHKPGGFVMKNNEPMTILRVVALAEGLTSVAAKSQARILRTDENGKRVEVPVNLGKVFSGKERDQVLKASDIVFVPNSPAKGMFAKGTDAAVWAVTDLVVFHW
ncbi:MAG: polysaccharide biosynthesis/export family protein [Candidatus Acidiferrales bacterium]